MNKEEDFLYKILDNLKRIEYIKPDDIPSISLYMDQVTTFMDEHLSSLRRFEDDKLLTKTMINNYTKNDLLPSPDKKKYSKDHMVLLIFIYYFKNVLSISDIQSILDPLTEKYFHNKDFQLNDIYDEIVSMEKEYVDSTVKDILKKYNRSRKAFADVDEEDKEFLNNFTFLCMLCFDVYMKKTIIEKMLDADILGGHGFDITNEKMTKKEVEAKKNQIKKQSNVKKSGQSNEQK